MIKGLLEIPFLYSLSQALLAPGAKKAVMRKVGGILKKVPAGKCLLDVGCGPSSLLWSFGLHPIGLDISRAYVSEYGSRSEKAVNASADNLPFISGYFDGVWSFGLLHHLPDESARRCIAEMLRVCCNEGYVVIFDGVLPENAWLRPVAWVIRKLDRGSFLRRQSDLERLLVNRDDWKCERLTYSYNGLEGLFCVYNLSSKR
jgi:SAM-dependent methyltransferase